LFKKEYNKMRHNITENSRLIVAKTMFGEARGEYAKKCCGIRSLIAIGNVIMNRHAVSDKSIEEVCLKPKQFSCWNDNDPNRGLLDGPLMDNEVFKICLVVAKQIIDNELGDITNGADHYYSKTMRRQPYWAAGRIPVFEIGNHVFFRLLPRETE
jgi:spore germination cell wall hydrolase CwlJ-like protein